MIAAISALFLPVSGVFLGKGSNKIDAPALNGDILQMLLKTQASTSGSEEDAFTKGCETVTKAVVASNDGNKKKVASHLYLVCSGLQLPLDVELCESYRSTLLSHIHKDAKWNLVKMDYPLFCEGMDKVVAAHKVEMEELERAPKANEGYAGSKNYACFKTDASYGYNGACEVAETVKMFGNEESVDWANAHNITNTVQTNITSAYACQAECKKEADCKFFTYLSDRVVAPWNDSCYLVKAVTCSPEAKKKGLREYGLEPQAMGKVWGPKSCEEAEATAQEQRLLNAPPGPPATTTNPAPAGLSP